MDEWPRSVAALTQGNTRRTLTTADIIQNAPFFFTCRIILRNIGLRRRLVEFPDDPACGFGADWVFGTFLEHQPVPC